jgi:hypothetical protein
MPARGSPLLALLAILLAPSAHADGPRTPRLAQADPHAECYCLAKGRRFGMGEQVCLRGPDGPRMARCVMDLNVTSWRPTGESCPDS